MIIVHGPSMEPSVYVKRVPKSFDSPPKAGWVLVHNHVRSHRMPAARGFRVWWQAKNEKIEPCPCGWYFDRGTHYRVVAITRQELGFEQDD
jgi:hypothetical protein